MKKAIIGQKMGMTQLFTETGTVVPVTVVLAGPCAIVQKKTKETDGYEALKVAFGSVKEKNVNKPDAGQFKKVGAAPARFLRELRLENSSEYEVGQSITCDIFSAGDKVDVVANSKGKGFTGVIQRWNQHRGPMSHGSGSHRVVGSMGANSTPSRVFKNKHMPGHQGNQQVTLQNLEIAKVDLARNVLLVKGALPGAKGALVLVKQSSKAK